MTTNGIHFDEEETSGPNDICCYEDSARSVEIVREENKDGQLGSFGFTIFQERPPRIGTVIPGRFTNITTLLLFVYMCLICGLEDSGIHYLANYHCCYHCQLGLYAL